MEGNYCHETFSTCRIGLREVVLELRRFETIVNKRSYAAWQTLQHPILD